MINHAAIHSTLFSCFQAYINHCESHKNARIKMSLNCNIAVQKDIKSLIQLMRRSRLEKHEKH